ncbi:RluA family pseudouridine synthase [Sporosarcina sp. Te-1]|uniref:RluA family pseudouridine synthase n=1 Tax=Sporosarcina sp. Te-1 TaxID=2818390 RepID=UPI001A9D2456|nr:RluA family pseudouridine synthase [Sporosarcina sp. Te-1]QTD42865.1 RluA family pseudouridine synthase [Sporosarcina sp. Te-1]
MKTASPTFDYQLTEDGLTIETLLQDKWEVGKKTVHQLRMAKSIYDPTGAPADWRAPLEIGTVLRFTFPDAASTYVPEDPGALEVLWEDQHLLVAKKPAGIATHPDHSDGTGTFMNRVMCYIQHEGGKYAEHVQRLDKGTGGLIVVAKHPIAKGLLDRMMERNEVTRTYRAEVEGRLSRMRGSLKYPIGRDRHHPTRRRVSPNGQLAITHFHILERLENSTVIEAKLDTGRTHQIRVHFSHIGHPIKGDTLYGGTETEDGHYRLTAVKVSFGHPITKELLTIE